MIEEITLPLVQITEGVSIAIEITSERMFIVFTDAWQLPVVEIEVAGQVYIMVKSHLGIIEVHGALYIVFLNICLLGRNTGIKEVIEDE